MKEAQFYKKLDNNKVQCDLCNHFCLINNDQLGICQVRKNINGTLYSLVYGQIIAEHVDPIEKKPLYHFLPGTLTYSIATMGCNFRCAHCQNADISQSEKFSKIVDIYDEPSDEIVPPEEIIKEALKNNCPSISYTYTEPTIFAEYALDCMRLAHEANLKNIWVTNGYTSAEALAVIIPYLDAVNVDLKFFKNETYLKNTGAKLNPVLETLKIYKQSKVWLEVTTLIIPGLNDSEEELTEIAQFICNELGPDVPWHVSAFYPAYKLSEIPPTGMAIIKKAQKIGKDNGLKYVYPGNI